MRSVLAAIILAALCNQSTETHEVKQPDAPLEVHAFDELAMGLAESGGSWSQFLDRPSLYAGVYRLPKGADDGQSPHEHDEVYYVVRGQATLEVAGERTAAAPGAILFVAAGAPHRFVDITEDLELLVFFSRGPVGEDSSGQRKDE